MPRNDQVTRQWHLLQRLSAARNGLTLAQLVEAIPPDLTRHPRTVRRDLAALEASHFPLLTERVDGEVRWRLMDGFRNVPSLRLSPTELMALAFSRQLLTPLQGTLIATSLNSALTKISAAIPSEASDYVQRLNHWFSVGLGPHKNYKNHRETIDILSQAIAHRRTIQMRYFSAGRGEKRGQATFLRTLRVNGDILLFRQRLTVACTDLLPGSRLSPLIVAFVGGLSCEFLPSFFCSYLSPSTRKILAS